MKIVKKRNVQLSTSAKNWMDSLIKEYSINDRGGLSILELGASAFDRLQQCRAAILQDGCTTFDKWGQIKPHPLLAAERDSRAQVMQSLKLLNLDFGDKIS